MVLGARSSLPLSCPPHTRPLPLNLAFLFFVIFSVLAQQTLLLCTITAASVAKAPAQDVSCKGRKKKSVAGCHALNLQVVYGRDFCRMLTCEISADATDFPAGSCVLICSVQCPMFIPQRG